jgi:hypothetical protein
MKYLVGVAPRICRPLIIIIIIIIIITQHSKIALDGAGVALACEVHESRDRRRARLQRNFNTHALFG